MLITFLISLIGHLIATRIIQSIGQSFSISELLVFRITSINLVLIGVLSILHKANHLSVWLYIGILLITLKFFPIFLRYFFAKQVEQALLPFLDSVILSMQSGKAFRVALMIAAENNTGWIRRQFIQIIESLPMPEHVIHRNLLVLRSFRAELVAVDQTSSHRLERLRALRRQKKLIVDFRRRSGQVTQQIKTQAAVISVLYSGLLFFVLREFGYLRYRRLIFISILLFLSGLVWIFRTGRRMKWKV